MSQLIHNHQIEALNERVTVKKLLPAEPCVKSECYPRLIQKNYSLHTWSIIISLVTSIKLSNVITSIFSSTNKTDRHDTTELVVSGVRHHKPKLNIEWVSNCCLTSNKQFV